MSALDPTHCNTLEHPAFRESPCSLNSELTFENVCQLGVKKDFRNVREEKEKVDSD